ncbi:MAG: hypothetical protein ABSC13_08320 [Dehalococcoidia bacterium]|jgi:hypothetical protein
MAKRRGLSPAARGRLGGLTTASRYSPAAITAPARAAFLKSFTPDDPEISDAERERRAKAARRLHFMRMAQRRWSNRKAGGT